ncbi:MAG TPA: MFS transporter [Xanthobacteraceae bacterium]|nr:MFS transporter [Xanthobacteraceae bacterium]
MLQRSPVPAADTGPDAKSHAKPDIDWRLLGPLLANSVIVQAVIGMLRVATTYRTIELELPVVWLGVISASFALLPVFAAVRLGRFIDRGNDSQSAWIGAGLILTSAIGFWAWCPTGAHLLAYTVVLGFGHMFSMAAHQMLAVRSASLRGRDSAFGHFMVAASTGQGLGPFMVGWLGGASTVPATGYLFGIGLLGAVACLAVALLLRPGPRSRAPDAAGSLVALGTLMRMPGMLAVIIASVVTVTSLDLLVVYLPLIGAERQVNANDIGMLLTIRAVAALVARAFFARLVMLFGRQQLTFVSIAVAAGAFALLALPSLALMYVAIIAVGLGLGIASTTTLSGVVDLAPPEARGTALSLRITGNRVGQVLVPFVASLIAAATGTAGILLVIAATLVASGTAARLSWRQL